MRICSSCNPAYAPSTSQMRITNLTKNTVLADKAHLAVAFKQRVVGLLGRSGLEQGEALILKNTSSVHTFGMKFTIDVLFINRKNIVVAALKNLKPFRLSALYPFSDAIELPAGTIQATQTFKGDIIQIK